MIRGVLLALGASRRRRIAAVALAIGGLCAVVIGGAGAGASVGAGTSCGSLTLPTIAAVDATVMTDIYRNELAGTEVAFDLSKVTGAADLPRAVAQENRRATLTAVQRIVYHPGWHIVRLRALDAAGRILADVGGPYVIAPVTGVLRSAAGVVVGSFVMSVQDDVGVTKLEGRFVGDPIGIYVKGRLVAQRRAQFPVTPPPPGSFLNRGGVRYRPVAQTFNAFPTGTLSAVILIAVPSPSLTTQPCEVVRAGEFGRVAIRLRNLLGPIGQHYFGYVTLVHVYTGAEVFVRVGGTQLASSGGPGPTVIPTSGTVSDQGVNLLVFSFAPRPATRIYVLVPPA